jgi:DNA-binding transcriptional regulator YdaS (Cro superfamily)
MEFKEWLYQNYSSWRGHSRKSVSGFASHLGISQFTVSRWMNGARTHPTDYKVIVALAHRYLEAYSVLDLPLPYGGDVQQLAEAWNDLLETEQQEILGLANAGSRQEKSQPAAVFSDWIYQKFYEWRGQSRSNKYVSQFAEYLDLPNPTVTQWVNSTRANPTDYRVIVALARQYPEIYLELGLPLPYCDEIQQVAEAWAGLPDEKRSQILAFVAGSPMLRVDG